MTLFKQLESLSKLDRLPTATEARQLNESATAAAGEDAGYRIKAAAAVQAYADHVGLKLGVTDDGAERIVPLLELLLLRAYYSLTADLDHAAPEADKKPARKAPAKKAA